MVQVTDSKNNYVNEKVHVSPIKTQGIKTKLVPWVGRYARLDADSLMDSGCRFMVSS